MVNKRLYRYVPVRSQLHSQKRVVSTKGIYGLSFTPIDKTRAKSVASNAAVCPLGSILYRQDLERALPLGGTVTKPFARRIQARI